jgi:predicted methyltransferase
LFFNQLTDEKMIVQFKDKKLVLLTEAGKQLAEKLKPQYLH